jgi:lysophospholipase L1-like esterase
VAAGHQVEIKDAFAKVLEMNLNQASKGVEDTVEVIILAQQGYSTSQELILLKNEAFKYSPDLIIWSYVLNDPAHPIYHDSNGELGRYHFRPRLHTANFIYKKLFLVREKYRWLGCERGEFHSLLHCAYRDQIQSNIEKIAQVSSENGIPIIFLIHPVFEKNGDFNSYSLAPVHKKLAELASNSGLSVLDLVEAYMPYNPEELARPMPDGYDPWHPNKKGHKIAADALFGYLSRTPQRFGLPLP